MKGVGPEDLLMTLILIVISVFAGVAGMILLVAAQTTQQDTVFSLSTSVGGSGISGLLKYPIAGDSFATISSRILVGNSFGDSGADSNTTALFLLRLNKMLSTNIITENTAAFYSVGGPAVYCGDTSKIAYCEYGENGCSTGRIQCTGSGCNLNVCGDRGICCQEILGSDKKFVLTSELEPVLCEDRRGVCEVISCAPGRTEIFSDYSCASALSRESDMNPVPIEGLDQPFVCCRPMEKKELRNVIFRKDVGVLQAPVFLPSDSANPDGYSDIVTINSGEVVSANERSLQGTLGGG